MKKKRFTQRLVAAAVSLVLVLALFPFTAFAEGGTGNNGEDDGLLGVDNTEPADYSSITTNPYGLKSGRTYQTVAEDELLMSMYTSGRGNNESNTSVQRSYDTFKSGTTLAASDAKSADNQTSNQVLTGINDSGTNFTSTKDWNNHEYGYIQAVALDINGTGRNSWIAYAGIDLVGTSSTYKHLCMWVVNTDDNTISAAIDVADLSYVMQIDGDFQKSAKFAQYTAKNYFSITAGDYDGNGKDSIVVGLPYSSGSAFYSGVIEYSYSESFAMAGRTEITKWNGTPTSLQCVPCIDVATGDFDGDGTDDLAALGYSNLLNSSYAPSSPQLAVFTSWSGGKIYFGTSATASVRDGGNDIDSYNYTMFAPSLSCGDTDGDGVDEIVVAGYGAKYTKSATGVQVQFLDKVDNTMGVAVACYSVVSGALNKMMFATTAMNTFTRSGLYFTDSNWQQLQCECVALDGPQAAESIFVGGTLYTMSDSSGAWALNSAYKQAFFDSGTGTGYTVGYVESVVAGDFDGNAYGREQAVFTVVLKTGTGKYYYKVGVVGGVYAADSSKTVGARLAYYGNNLSNAANVIDGFYGGENGVWLNCVPIAADVDSDGYRMTYLGRSYMYTDPTVEAVLQAAPYFDGVTDPGSTSYSVTTAFTAGSGSSDNVSIGAGCSLDLEKGAGAKFEFSVEAGYTCDISLSTESEATKTYTKTFTAGATNTVLVQRTPVIIYDYQVDYLGANGEKKTGYQTITVPLQPVWSQLTIDEYNTFVDDYNKKATATNNKYGYT